MKDDVALDALGLLLYAPRQVLLRILDDHGNDWTPASGSPAEVDLAGVLFPVPEDSSLTDEGRKAGRFPKPRDNEFLVRHPRSVASLHVRVGADYLAGEGALLSSGETVYPPLALARVAFEHAARAITILDPWVDHNVRCARAMIEDVASAHRESIVWKRLTDGTNMTYRAKRARYRAFRDLARRCFEVEVTGSGPGDWTIAGEGYLRPSAAIARWRELQREPMPAKGLYDLLSLYVHPQAFSSRREARFDEFGETWMELDLDQLRWASTWVIACWVDAARLLLGHYQGWDVGAEFDELVNATGAVAEFDA